MNTKATKDRFEIDGNIIVCHSASGKTYHLTRDTCDCMAFGFRRSCRHRDEAKEAGLFEKLAKVVQKPKGFIFRTPHIIEMRKNAVVQFLRKHKVRFTQALIDKLEPMLTMNMDVKKFLATAKRA